MGSEMCIRDSKITMTVPFHFVGEEQAPGVKAESGIMTHNIMSVDVICLGSDLPEYVEVDCSELGMGDSIQLSQVALPEGVEFSSSYQEQEMEQQVATVLPPQAKSATALAEEAEAEAAAEAAAAEGEGDSEE